MKEERRQVLIHPSSFILRSGRQGSLYLGGASHIERRDAALVCRAEVGPTLSEELNELPTVDGAAQRRLTFAVTRVDGSAVIEECRCYRCVASARGLMQRRSLRGTAWNVRRSAGFEENASHLSGRGAIKRRVPLHLASGARAAGMPTSSTAAFMLASQASRARTSTAKRAWRPRRRAR
jgi:hypothetical protein